MDHPPPKETPKGLVSTLTGAKPDEGQSCLSIQVGLYLKEVFKTRADEGPGETKTIGRLWSAS